MKSDDQARNARAALRRTWPIEATALRARPTPSAVDDPAARLASVWRLTLDCWAIAGRPLPTYSRADMPGRILRLADDR